MAGMIKLISAALLVLPGSAQEKTTKQSVLAASQELREQAANSIVRDAVINAMVKMPAAGSQTTLTYERGSVNEMVPYVAQLLHAGANCTGDIAAALSGSSFVGGDGEVLYSQHTITYSIAGENGATSFAHLVQRVSPELPNKRTLFLFRLRSSFRLLPNLVYRRSCTRTAGLLGTGSAARCVVSPTAVPRTLDASELAVLDAWFTSFALDMLAGELPDASVSNVPEWIGTQSDVPPEYMPTISQLRGRTSKDRAMVQKCMGDSSNCSAPVRELINGGFDKWESDLTIQSMQKITPDGAPQIIAYIAQRENITDPAFLKVLSGILTSEKPVVYATMTSDSQGNCEYFLIIGNSTVGQWTDLLEVRATASFTLAPDILVVRQTKASIWGVNTTDKIVKKPHSITQADIDAVFAFFEVSVVDRLSQLPVARSGQLIVPRDNPPGMPGHTPKTVPEWEKMISAASEIPELIETMAANIAKATAAWGAIGGMLAGVLGLLPLLIMLFHTTHSHSDVIIGELQGHGFKHFRVDQEGPIYYKQLPYVATLSGKQYYPVNQTLNELFHSHLADVPKPKDRSDVVNYILAVANGWTGGESVYMSQAFHYNSNSSGVAKVFKIITNANPNQGYADIMFWSTDCDITLADNLLIHRVTDITANIFHSKSVQYDYISYIPQSITYNETQALFQFFDIMAFQSFASTLGGFCDALPSYCTDPDIMPGATPAPLPPVPPVPADCPGGSMENCLSACPTSPPDAYQNCAGTCSARCGNGPPPSAHY